MPRPPVASIKLNSQSTLFIDKAALTQSLVDIAFQSLATFLGVTDGISSCISAVSNIFGTVKESRTIENLAWDFFWLSFAMTLDTVFSDENREKSEAKDKIHNILISKEKDLSIAHEIPVNFFDKPSSCQLYIHYRNVFISGLSSHDSSGMKFIYVGEKFDSAFNRSVFDLACRRYEGFRDLLNFLESDIGHASTLDLQWKSYRSKLIFDFEVKPVFGQESAKISLSQIYIPLRGEWLENVDSNNAGKDGSLKVAHLCRIEDELHEWLNKYSEEDSIKLLGGGPGSGKSTTLRSFAALIARRDDIKPVYIPLQHISIDGDLRVEVSKYLTGQVSSPFTVDPLDRSQITDGPNFVFMFDGLDEISRPGEGADDVAHLFITRLDTLLRSMQGEGRTPRALVTGRMPAFQAARKFRGANGRGAIEVKGFLPLATHLNTLGDSKQKEREIAVEDQRGAWWKKYALAIEAHDPDQVPTAYSHVKLSDITNEPLLCYLLALSGLAIDDWEIVVENKNTIYSNLLHEIYNRRWGSGGRSNNREGAGKELSYSEFMRLMECIALAAWLDGDTRVATEERFIECLELLDADKYWKQFLKDGGVDMKNLALNFYLRSSEGNRRGFEFTHKSFGEYLVASALLSVASSVAAMQEMSFGTKYAAIHWSRTTCGGRITIEILTFLRDQVRLVGEEQRTGNVERKILGTFCSLANLMMQEGLPTESFKHVGYKALSKAHSNVESSVWAVINSCIRYLRIQLGDHTAKVEVNFLSAMNALGALIIRLTGPEREITAVRGCLEYIEAMDANLFAMDLRQVSFQGSNLARVNFRGTHLLDANLSECDLTKARFDRANLDRCKMIGADVDHAEFIDCRSNGMRFLDGTIGTVEVSWRTYSDYVENDRDDKLEEFENGRGSAVVNTRAVIPRNRIVFVDPRKRASMSEKAWREWKTSISQRLESTARRISRAIVEE